MLSWLQSQLRLVTQSNLTSGTLMCSISVCLTKVSHFDKLILEAVCDIVFFYLVGWFTNLMLVRKTLFVFLRSGIKSWAGNLYLFVSIHT